MDTKLESLDTPSTQQSGDMGIPTEIKDTPWILETYLRFDSEETPVKEVDDIIVKHIVGMGNLIAQCGGIVATYIASQIRSLDIAGASVSDPGPIQPGGLQLRVQFIVKGNREEVVERIIPHIERKVYADLCHVVIFGAPQVVPKVETDSPNQTKLFQEDELNENI